MSGERIETGRRSRGRPALLVAAQLLVLAGVASLGQVYASHADWDPLLVATLFFQDRLAKLRVEEARARLEDSRFRQAAKRPVERAKADWLKRKPNGAAGSSFSQFAFARCARRCRAAGRRTC